MRAARSLMGGPLLAYVPAQARVETAADHRWMGRPLGAYPNEELLKIMGALQDVAFGEPRIDMQRHLGRDRALLIKAIADLDIALDAVRGAGGP